MLSIRNHRLVGDGVAFRATPNVGSALKPSLLIFHYTAGSSAASSIESLCTHKPQGNASAHLVLARDGSITQLAPFNVVTWHAGVSQWLGVDALNNTSIGIEVDNAGPMNQVGDRFVAWFGRDYPASEVLMAAHKHGGPVRPWHAYTEAQITRCLELAELLCQHYRLQDVLGHDDIARGRKQDPGPAFPLTAIAGRALGRGDDAPAHFVVSIDELNIRRGPGAGFDAVAVPLARGTVVRLLKAGDRWSRVEIDGPSDVEGWVNNRFIVRTKAAPRAAPRKAAAKRVRGGVKKAAKPATAKSAVKLPALRRAHR